MTKYYGAFAAITWIIAVTVFGYHMEPIRLLALSIGGGGVIIMIFGIIDLIMRPYP
jgi:hypothetical protein